MKQPLRSIVRILLLLAIVLGGAGLVYLFWSPGLQVRDGRHDRGANGTWLQHGWLGDDAWFATNERDPSRFRDPAQIRALAALLAGHGVTDVFPHLCPCDPKGPIAGVDAEQTERFLDAFEGLRVIPWVGGVLGVHCSPNSERWRTAFAASVADLLRRHPRLAGVQVNIEPMPSGDASFLLLLDELRQALPEGKLLSVAAYPPPTRWHPFPDVHWDEAYFRQVAARADQLAVMMYDTAIQFPKVYQYVMAAWTYEVLAWGRDTNVLLGVPTYDDPGVGYHHPSVENLRNALLGIHAALASFESLPDSYRGIALYCEWETDDDEWRQLRAEFGASE